MSGARFLARPRGGRDPTGYRYLAVLGHLVTRVTVEHEIARPQPPAVGMHGVLRRLGSFRTRGQASENVFRSEGETWLVTFAGRSVAVPHAKGMQDLHMLLSRPRIDVPVRVLIEPNGGGEWSGPAASMSVIDTQAKAAYCERLVSLATAIEEALQVGHDARA